jgi:hypothetical protein
MNGEDVGVGGFDSDDERDNDNMGVCGMELSPEKQKSALRAVGERQEDEDEDEREQANHGSGLGGNELSQLPSFLKDDLRGTPVPPVLKKKKLFEPCDDDNVSKGHSKGNRYDEMVAREDGRGLASHELCQKIVRRQLEQFEEYVNHKADDEFSAGHHDMTFFYSCEALDILKENSMCFAKFVDSFEWPLGEDGVLVSQIIITPFVSFGCCGSIAFTGGEYLKVGRKDTLNAVGKIVILRQLETSVDSEVNNTELSSSSLLPKDYVKNFSRIKSEHKRMSEEGGGKKRHSSLVEPQINSGGGGGGGSDEEEGVIPLAPKIIDSRVLKLSRVQQERHDMQQMFLINVATHFQRYYYLFEQDNVGLLQRKHMAHVRLMKQKWKTLKPYKLPLERLLPLLYKLQNVLPHSQFAKLLLKFTVLEAPSADMSVIGSVMGSINVEKVLSLGGVKVSQLMVALIRLVMDEAYIIKGSVSATDDIFAAKMHKESFDDTGNGSGRVGGRGALWNACQLTAGERSGKGKMAASSIVIARFAQATYQYLKYLTVQVSHMGAYQILERALQRVESEITILVAAYQRNTDALKVLNINNNMPLMLDLTLRMKVVMEKGIPVFAALIKFLLTGQGGGFKGMSIVDRRRYLFSNGILAQQLQGYLQTGIALHIGAERAQVLKDCYILDNNATNEVEMAKLGQLFVSAIMFYLGAYHLIICQDKVSRFSDMKIVLLPKHLQLAVILMHEYRYYILNDEFVRFPLIPMLPMKNGLVKKTFEKVVANHIEGGSNGAPILMFPFHTSIVIDHSAVEEEMEMEEEERGRFDITERKWYLKRSLAVPKKENETFVIMQKAIETGMVRAD